MFWVVVGALWNCKAVIQRYTVHIVCIKCLHNVCIYALTCID